MSVDLDAADLIDSLSTGDYTVTRTAAGTFAAGIAVPGAISSVTITAAVYQATGRDLERLPEARRSIESRVLFTVTRLYTGAQHGVTTEGDYEADRVAIDGRAFELQHVGAFPGSPGYYSCIVQAVAG